MRILGIVGMGGIGKTTMANVLFDELSRDGTFRRPCFVRGIRENMKTKGAEQVQHHMLKKLTTRREEPLDALEGEISLPYLMQNVSCDYPTPASPQG